MQGPLMPVLRSLVISFQSPALVFMKVIEGAFQIIISICYLRLYICT